MSFFRFSQIKRVATLIVASMFLIVSTACSNPNVTADGASSIFPEKEGKPTTQYGGKPKADLEGGMNRYSDTDPRRDTAAAEAKTKFMVDKAKKQASRQSDPIQEVKSELDKSDIPETIEKVSTQVNRSVQRQVSNTAEAAKDGLQSLADQVS